MYSLKNHVYHVYLLVNIFISHGLSIKLFRESPAEDSKTDNLGKQQNSSIISAEPVTSLRHEFGESLFPVRIVVTMKKKSVSFLELSSTLKETIESGPVSKFEHLSNVGSYMIELSENCSKHELNSLIREIKELGGVVEFDTLAHSATQSVDELNRDKKNSRSKRPSSKYSKKQWHIPEMNVNGAWNRLKNVSTRDVKVCVVDSGIDYKNNGFSGRLALEKQIDKHGSDNDSNSNLNRSTYVNTSSDKDVLVSANFVDENFDPMDNLGHGTHISGIISSNYRNSKVAGINPFAKIVSCKAFDSTDKIRLTNVVRCIDFCLYSEAEIQNHTWVVTKKLKFVKRAFASAHKRGVIMVVSAGNLDSSNTKNVVKGNGPRGEPVSSPNIDLTFQFPASYSRVFPNVVSAANLMLLDKIKSKDMVVNCMKNSKDYCNDFGNLALNEDSMYGEGSVQVAAPGTNIYSLFLQNSHALMSGSSTSTAMVTGVLSLIKSASPKPSDVNQLQSDYLKTIQIMRESIRSVPNLEGKIGWKGLPDCKSAIYLTLNFFHESNGQSPRSARRKLTL